MVEAAFWGLLGASSLIVGALLAFYVPISSRNVGLIMAFGAGVLMSAVAYELVAEALHDGPWVPEYIVAFAGGATVFFIGSYLIDRRADAAPKASSGQGLAIVLGSVLDGIPESIVLGVSLIGGGAISVPMLLAVFISNVPESLGASVDLHQGGETKRRILSLWTIVAVASGIAAGLGYAVLSAAPAHWISAVQMFAGGAIIAMLAESMVPEASAKGGRAVGLFTALGFAASAILSAAT
jgi:ZIP family zinc transporter